MQVAVFLVFVILSLLGGYKFGLDWLPNFFVLIIASIDNGALLAERALSLSEEQIPWPYWLPFKEHLNHLFKNQRTALPYIGLWISLPMKAIFAICATLLIGH